MEESTHLPRSGNEEDNVDMLFFERDALVFRLMGEPTKMSYEVAVKEANKILREAREERNQNPEKSNNS